MSDKKHLVFVVNPHSGTLRRKDMPATIAQYLDTSVFSFDIQETKFPHHGTALAKQAAADGAFGVVAVGGDGSVNDVAAGLAGTGAALGIIPLGSGNGMARTLGIPRQSAGAMQVLNRQNVIQIDIGYANEKPFVSNAGMGFDAVVSGAFAKSRRRGFAAYAWLSGKEFFRYRPRTYQLTIDGDTRVEQAFLVNIANGRQFGYNFQIAPGASFTDGLLDVVILRAFPKIKGLAITLRGFRGSLLNSRYVTHLQGREVRLQTGEPMPFQIDGDAVPGTGDVFFRVAPAALKIFAP